MLEIPAACDIDLQLLEQKYRAEQNQWHPDRFAGAEDVQRMVAVQKTSLLNDAYGTLKTPLLRAAHLLEIHGADVSSHRQTQLEPAFLLTQMELRETLEDAQASASIDALGQLLEQVCAEHEQHWEQFCTLLEQGNIESAQRTFYKLQFLQKLQDEIKTAEDKLLGY